MVLTPILIEKMPIPAVQLIYGGIAALSAVLFVILARENPRTPPCPPGMEARSLMLDGLKHALTVRFFWYYLLVSFLGMGIFNGITTWVENIIRPRGFSPAEAGALGALLLIGGILGAVIIPPFSDKQRKRQRFLFLGILLAIPGLVGLTFVTSYLVITGLCLYFGLLSREYQSHRHAVCCRSNLPYTGGHFEWADPALWAGLCHFRLHHGSHAG